MIFNGGTKRAKTVKLFEGTVNQAAGENYPIKFSEKITNYDYIQIVVKNVSGLVSETIRPLNIKVLREIKNVCVDFNRTYSMYIEYVDSETLKISFTGSYIIYGIK
jgi:hypothetical protein